MTSAVLRRLSAASRWSTLASVLVWLLAGVACRGMHGGGLESTASDQWVRSYDLIAGGELQVVAGSGNISVERGTSSKVDVIAERIAKAGSDSIAKDVLPRVVIREDITGEKVLLQTEGLGGFVIGVSVTVNYQIKVPAGTRVRARSANGNVTVKDLDAQVSATTENGNITATDLSRGAELRSVNGSVSASLSAFDREAVDMRTTNGRIDLAVPSSINANLLANVRNGKIEIADLPWEQSSEASSPQRVRGRLNAGGSPIELTTVNGSIKVHAR